MPLNHVLGEQIGDLGHDYKVVPASKWRDTAFFQVAAAKAGASFKRSGAVWPVTFPEGAVLVQEYRGKDALAFIFARHVGSQERFAVHVVLLSPGVKRELIAQGLWEAPGRMDS